ncbi:hypothetical protein EDD86DRAFT_204939 [Gorgonomyces haynaldii]|nr:hypothetical protein EDD86DRAFT_204939 [Gorgonomyces haynaldii]
MLGFKSHLTKNYGLIPSVDQTTLGQSATPRLAKLSGTKYPYQIVFSFVEGVSTPNVSKQQQLECYLLLSLFDLETNQFVGRTFETVHPLWKQNLKKQDKEDEYQADLSGTRLNMRLTNQCIYFHTSIKSPHLVCVIEIVFKTDKQSVSGGWTLLHLFNHQRGGLHLERTWEEEGEEQADTEPKIAPLFSGTPRILPFVSSLFIGAATGYPGLTPIQGASLRFHLLARPDVRPQCFLWKENILVGPGTQIPGVLDISIKGIDYIPGKQVKISQIGVNVTPSVGKFESLLLDRIANHHFEQFPDSMTPDEQGQLPQPTVTERRLHFGFHNGFCFLAPPVIVNLNPEQDEDGNASILSFLGNVDLERFIDDPNVAIVFMVEYKVILTVNVPKEKKTAFSKIVDKISGNGDTLPGQELLEKFCCVGWGAWQPMGSQVAQVSLHSLDYSASPNPFAALMYRATSDMYLESRDNLEEVILGKEEFLRISFNFGTPEKPVETPVQAPVAIAEEEETEEPKSPKRRVSKKPQMDLEDQEMVESPLVRESPTIVDVPGPSPSHLKSRLSRIERARLHKAGFEKYVDKEGNPLSVLDINQADTAKIETSLDLEFQDKLVNDLRLTFMGVTLSPEFLNHRNTAPTSVYFSFQFYNFPYLTTERLKVYTGDLPPVYEKQSPHTRAASVPQTHVREWSHMSTKSFQTNNEHIEHQWPAILYRLETDGRAAYDRPPGLTTSFLIDPFNEVLAGDSNRYGALAFPSYMAQKQLYIDVWDGESLMYLGTACLDLATGLRQGKLGIQVDEDIDIVFTQYSDDTAGHSRSSSFSSQAPRLPTQVPISMKIGSLHLRMCNIGQTPHDGQGYASKPALKDPLIAYDYHHVREIATRTTAKPSKLSDVDAELNAVLKQARKDRSRADEETENRDPTETRRLQKAFEALESDRIAPKIKTENQISYERSRHEKERDLKTSEIFRERRKRQVITDALRNQITSTYTIHSSFGQGHFFEFLLVNPFKHDQVFDIGWENDLIRVIDSEKEWRYHRKMNGMVGAVEKSMIQVKPDGTAQVFIEAKERLSIPFIYQSFRDLSTFALSTTNTRLTNADPVASRVIPVTFSTGSLVVAVLNVLINPRNFYVDRSMRLFRSENELVHKTIRFPALSKIPLGEPDSVRMIQPSDEKYLRCSHPDVACQLDWRNDGNHCQIKFKYRCQPAGETTSLYFILYSDPYCTSVYEIWRVFVHSLSRMDVNCVIGQTNATSIVVRGPSVSRSACAFSSAPTQVQVQQAPFQLMANALNEVPILLRPGALTMCDLMVNVVDVDTHTLISSWMLVIHSSLPPVTKVFEIVLPKGKQSNKRVSYTNPFLHPKVLSLQTDSPELVQFKEAVLNLDGGSTQFIGLKFAPSHLPQAEIMVFLNNEYDRIEECLLIKARYE